jgi:hypothetical protein
MEQYKNQGCREYLYGLDKWSSCIDYVPADLQVMEPIGLQVHPGKLWRLVFETSV